ncbi:MAG: DUF4091 domain-containing protein [Isosphaeraceae bacterium]
MSKRNENRLMAVALFGIACAMPAAGADWRAATVTDTRRVLREETDIFNKKVSGAIRAARNEWESFQILIRSTVPVRSLTIDPGDLTGPLGSRLPASAARIYRQHQFEITTASARNKSFKAGWYPDALIPLRHPTTGALLSGARFAAVPFDLPADQTHGFLVDLHIPADARPGDYHGVYRVKGERQDAIEIPVSLRVWNFVLPDTPTLQAALGSPTGRMRQYYRRRNFKDLNQQPVNWDAVEEQCAQLVAEHRINATPSRLPEPVAGLDGSFQIVPEQVKALQSFIDRYHVNALQLPHPDNIVKGPERQRGRLQAWLNAWDRAIEAVGRPSVVFYFYLRDEPNDEAAYRYVQTWGRAIRQTGTRVKVMVVEQPQTQDEGWGNLHGAVDIWCPLFCLFEPKPAEERRAAGESIWTYTALCQGKTMTPWWQTDFPLLHYRVPSWIAWRYHIRGLLYWGGMSYWNDVDDPWIDAGTYRPGKRRGGPVYNGEGSLVYPARAVGYDGIVPSLRLKALRDSIEDYEYLCIMDRLGQRETALKEVLPLAGSWTRWTDDPAAFAQARKRLAEAIEHAK